MCRARSGSPSETSCWIRAHIEPCSDLDPAPHRIRPSTLRFPGRFTFFPPSTLSASLLLRAALSLCPVSILYHVKHASVRDIYITVGPNYQEVGISRRTSRTPQWACGWRKGGACLPTTYPQSVHHALFTLLPCPALPSECRCSSSPRSPPPSAASRPASMPRCGDAWCRVVRGFSQASVCRRPPVWAALLLLQNLGYSLPKRASSQNLVAQVTRPSP